MTEVIFMTLLICVTSIAAFPPLQTQLTQTKHVLQAYNTQLMVLPRP